MLTRLKVNGFKNLVDVDVRFGPLTCIAGVNGSGKSNLFDAIRFLALLAEKPLVEAALAIVRGSGGRSADIRSLFHRVGDEYAQEMSFEAEMIIPSEGIDDLHRLIRATWTYLRYDLRLLYMGNAGLWPSEPLQILHEELSPISPAAVGVGPGFSYGSHWWESAIRASNLRRSTIFDIRDGAAITWQPGSDPDSDAVEHGRLDMRAFPRTVLSSNSIGSISSEPEVRLARQEMRSWRVLHLDPAAMRTPDDVTAPTIVGSDGAHVAATLYSIAHEPPTDGRDPYEAETAVYARVANRIRRLFGDIWDLTVERDDKREEFTIFVTDRNGTRFSARELSDGTLRVLALAVIEEEQRPGVLCIEEPENGVHPGRLESMLKLLQAIAMDTNYPIEEGNPLRQVIISTHSPSVVMRVPADSLVMAELRDTVRDGKRFNRAYFSGLANTWRDPDPDMKSLALRDLWTYLNPDGYRPLPEPDPERDPDAEVRVMDRADVRRMLTPRTPA